MAYDITVKDWFNQTAKKGTVSRKRFLVMLFLWSIIPFIGVIALIIAISYLLIFKRKRYTEKWETI